MMMGGAAGNSSIAGFANTAAAFGGNPVAVSDNTGGRNNSAAAASVAAAAAASGGGAIAGAIGNSAVVGSGIAAAPTAGQLGMGGLGGFGMGRLGFSLGVGGGGIGIGAGTMGSVGHGSLAGGSRAGAVATASPPSPAATTQTALGGHSIFATAMGRWLNVSELEALLNVNTTPLSISMQPPAVPPPSGTLVLYDRSVTRNYKDDGYEWIKKRNSPKVREDHVKLRVGGKYRVAGCYVHCATTVTFHRRAYHLLDPETGTALHPPTTGAAAAAAATGYGRAGSFGDGTGGSDGEKPSGPSLVLVHYLDTDMAALHSAKLAAEGVASDSSSGGNESSRGRGRGRGRANGRSRSKSRGRRGRRARSPSGTAAAAAAVVEEQKAKAAAAAAQTQLLQQQQAAAAFSATIVSGGQIPLATSSMSVQAQMQAMQQQAAQAQAQAQKMLQQQEQAAQAQAQAQQMLQQVQAQQAAAGMSQQQQQQQQQAMQAAAVAQLAMAQQAAAARQPPQKRAAGAALPMFTGLAPGTLPSPVVSQQKPQLEPLRNQDQLNRLQARLHQQQLAAAAHAAAAAPSPMPTPTPPQSPPPPKPPLSVPSPVPAPMAANEAMASADQSSGTVKAKKSSDCGGFEDDTLDILWGMVVEEGGDDIGDMLDNGNLGVMLEDSGACGEESGDLDAILSDGGDDKEGEEDVEEAGMAVVAAFEREMRAAKRSLDENKARGANIPASIAAELAAAVDDAAVTGDVPQEQEPQPSDLDRQLDQQIMLATEQMQSQLQSNVHVTGGDNNGVERSDKSARRSLKSANSMVMEDVAMDAAASAAPASAPAPMPLPVAQASPPIAAEPPVPLSEVVDFTPEFADIAAANKKPMKVVLSCSEPLGAVPSTGSDRVFKWHTISAFVDVSVRQSGPMGPSLEIRSVDLSPVRKLNPYTYRCTVPRNAKEVGDRRIAIVAVRLYAGTEPVCEGVAAGVAVSLQQAWREALAADPTTGGLDELGRPVLQGGSSADMSSGGGGPNIRIMTQLSEEMFEFRGATGAGSNLASGLFNTSRQHSSGSFVPAASDGAGLPAPPAAMAMVATALPDFPDPPAKAVVEPGSLVTIFNSPNKTPGTTTGMRIDDLSGTPGGSDTIAAALEATATSSQAGSRKRASSTRDTRKRTAPNIDAQSGELFNSFGAPEESKTTDAASQWAAGPGLNSQDESMGGEIDRHCKIRFVERLSSVMVAGNGGNGSTPDDSEGLNLDDAQLNAMEDDKLDSVLDGLLVRVVESLVEMSASCYELQEELNAPDKSGFSLLHYAALYNLQSLIPVLLSRGANPDTPTVRGKLTPLHLACGAGNFAIVELLVRNGCAVRICDSFGSFPADHATRNGFPEIAQWLTEKTGADKQKMSELRALEEKRRNDLMELENEANLSSAERIQNNGNSDPHQILLPASFDNENNKQLLQTAFSNLSLKDKLALNLLVRKRQMTMHEDVANYAIAEGDKESSSNDAEAIQNHKLKLPPVVGSKSGHDACDGEALRASMPSGRSRRRRSDTGDLDVASVISESDKASLDIAMRLMNEEELEELENRSQDIDGDLRKWMLKRNYESLKEASLYLKKTLETNDMSGRESPGSQSPDFPKTFASTKDQKAAKRSLQNVKSQAIAGLVIRKNMSRLHVGSGLSGKPHTPPS